MLMIFFRAVFLYLVLIATIRLLGKRQLGQLEPSEVAVTMLIADLASIPMQDTGIPLFSGLVPILTVLGVELVLSGIALRSVWARKLLCGKPVILMENGKILQENLRATRVTLDELTMQLREKDVLDLQTVQYAILETNGSVSVFVYPEHRPATAEEAKVEVQPQYLPVTIISDGRLLRNNLSVAGKDMQWLARQLRRRGVTQQQTWLLTVDGGDNVVFLPKEGKT